jgi:hypothetical protein
MQANSGLSGQTGLVVNASAGAAAGGGPTLAGQPIGLLLALTYA